MNPTLFYLSFLLIISFSYQSQPDVFGMVTQGSKNTVVRMSPGNYETTLVNAQEFMM